ncbi:spore coat protein, partial [Thermodesulfitimonas autotrophica]|uniref:spore coat protein n=1 Tax=Thermodesulfitimonas autotrophica TaxID=1894989 RepID=UPI002FDFEBA2
MQLDERDILTDCLIDAKFFSHGYHMAALESAHDQVRNAFIRMMNDEITGAKMLFDAMHQRGRYPVDMAHAGAQPYHAAG